MRFRVLSFSVENGRKLDFMERQALMKLNDAAHKTKLFVDLEEVKP